MKVHRTHHSVATYVYLPLTVGYLLMYFFQPAQLPSIRTAHWVFLALTVLFLISPQRKKRFGAVENRLPWPKWLVCITGFVSLMECFFYFTQVFIDQVLTINKPASLPLSTSISFFEQGGLYPWALIALFTLTIQHVYTGQQSSVFFSRCLQPIFDIKDHSNLGIYCNQHLRTTNFAALCSALTFIGLASLTLFMHFTGLHLSVGLNLVTMIATTVLFSLATYTRWISGFNWLIQYHCPPLLALLLMVSSAMLILAIPLAGLPYLPNTQVINYQIFNPSAWPLFYGITTLFLALCWVPLASATLAILSRGYCAWQTITAILLVPFLTTVVNQIKPSWQTSLSLNDPTIVAIALIACSCVLLWFFLRPAIVLAVWRAIYPLNIELRDGKPVMYIRTIITTSIGMIALYWGTGVYLGALALSALALGPLLLIMLAVFYWIVPLALFQNQNQNNAKSSTLKNSA